MNLRLAQSLISHIHNAASQQQLAVAAAATDAHGELVAFIKMDACSLQAAHLAKMKAYTAARDRQPSANLGKWAQATGKDMGYWCDPNITGLGGGLPIYQNGEVIGAIGVSGLSEQDDAQLAENAIAAFPQ